MELLKEWKGKIKETFKDVVGELDPAEKRLSDLVERATSESLQAPDLGLNLAVVDEVNTNPDVAIDAITRAVRRAFLKPNPHVQLLSLALLEMLVKNSVPQFFHYLATSELWAEILRVGDPARRWDPEVRDRALCLIEDWGRGLPLQAYKDAYEGLVDRGVDFPARPLSPDDEGAPYYTAPVLPPRPPPAYGAPPIVPGASGGGAGAGYPTSGGGGPLIGPDVSPEDAQAIRAAVAEMEAEEAARRASSPPGGPGSAAAPAAAAQGGTVPGPGGPVPGVPAVPRSPRSIEQAVRVASNSAELLSEMLAPLAAAAAAGGASGDASGVGEPFITDLADQCYRHRSVLSEVIPNCESEELLSAALAANDELSRALATFQDLAGAGAHTRGASGAGAGPGAASDFAAPGAQWRLQQQLGSLGSGGAAGGPALPTSSSAGAALSGGGGLLSAGGTTANFSLLDEGDEEEAAELTTNRAPLTGRSAAPSGGGAASGGGEGVAPARGSNLIDLNDIDVAPAAPQRIEDGVARLGLGADSGKPAQR